MPQPTRGDVHVERALTNISVAYIQQASNFISDTIFPIVPVEFRSDKYYVWTSPDFRRNTAKPRAPGTESAGGGMRLSTDSYSCEVYAIHKDIDDQTRANADPQVDLEMAASTFITHQMLIEKEVSWVSTFFTTGVWQQDLVGGTNFTPFSDGSSDPEKVIADARIARVKQTGYRPNKMVVSMEVHEALKRHPLITARYQHSNGQDITAAILARYFEVDTYLVAEASYTTSNEDAVTETNEFIVGNNILLAYVPSSPGLMVPSAGYTFVWRGFIGSSSGYRTKRFRMENLESDRIEGEWSYDHKRVTQQMGTFFSAVL